MTSENDRAVVETSPGALPKIVPIPSPTDDDDLSVREAAAFSGGVDLEASGKVREHHRHQKFRDHVNRATLLVLWLIVACVVVGILVFVWHLVLPPQWRWLADSDRDQLQTLLGAALLSSALTNYARQRMEG